MLSDDLSISYAQLPANFYARVDPTPVSSPRLVKFNYPLAVELSLDVTDLDGESQESIWSGNRLIPGSLPMAMAYAGHQFGHFVPQLGDGRAILLGEVKDRFAQRRDIQLKGAGRTPYSRSGDGRAALGPVLREYVVSEAMHALGIPATRALAVVTTGEFVLREATLPGAILTRVAASHVRVGTFQFFASRGDFESIRRLADYVIERHYPHAATAADPYLELLRSVVQRQALLIARWMHVGFIHGVMNTDNMAVSGETIDFGPCAFMDQYDPMAVFSSIDHRGRYAYSNQPLAAQWNLARFAETLLPLIDASGERSIESATEAVDSFSPEFDRQWISGMRRKMGLLTEVETDGALARGLLDAMHRGEADFTLTFRRLCDPAFGDAAACHAADAAIASHWKHPDAFRPWAEAWRLRLSIEPQWDGERGAAMRLANPAVIPRNHRIEQAIAAAVEHGNFVVFEKLCEALSQPFAERPEYAEFEMPPRLEERVLQTYCGT